MKKLLCMLLALLAIGGCALAETENKTDEAVLNIFTWEGYIDYETVIKPFEQETGIKVNYATFSSNEEMYEKLSAVNGGDYDVVLANIVADVIIPLSRVVPEFLQEDSIFICSGILNTRLPEVLDALEKNGLQILSTEQQEDWCRVTAALLET